MEQKKSFSEIIKDISRIWKIIVFVFVLGVTRSGLNSRITHLESKVKTFDAIKIESTLMQIQTDITWIKTDLKTRK